MYIRFYQNPFLIISACVSVCLKGLYRYGPRVGGATALLYTISPDTAYWLLMGIASSIGLGSGYHSGLLHLFPMVAEVSASNTPIDAIAICTIPVLAWGVGTALGEIPPYLGARAILEANIVSKEAAETARNALRDREWLVIFLMASYPNMTFDAAGVAAGLSGMNIYSFSSAVICGKALVKAPTQALVAAVIGSGMSYDSEQLPGYVTVPRDAIIASMMFATIYFTIEALGNLEISKGIADG
jgi:membrane protein YqaA with SNARE-associated domain